MEGSSNTLGIMAKIWHSVGWATDEKAVQAKCRQALQADPPDRGALVALAWEPAGKFLSFLTHNVLSAKNCNLDLKTAVLFEVTQNEYMPKDALMAIFQAILNSDIQFTDHEYQAILPKALRCCVANTATPREEDSILITQILEMAANRFDVEGYGNFILGSYTESLPEWLIDMLCRHLSAWEEDYAGEKYLLLEPVFRLDVSDSIKQMACDAICADIDPGGQDGQTPQDIKRWLHPWKDIFSRIIQDHKKRPQVFTMMLDSAHRKLGNTGFYKVLCAVKQNPDLGEQQENEVEKYIRSHKQKVAVQSPIGIPAKTSVALADG